MIRYAVRNDTYQKFTLDIRGQDMTVVLYYVLQNDAWYADITSDTGEIVAQGERMVSGIDTGFKFGIPGVFIAGPNGEAHDPDGEGWDNLYFYVLTLEELDIGPLFAQADPTYLIDAMSDPIVDSDGLFLVVE